MRITSLTLSGVSGLQVSRIKELEIDIVENTQLIIGSNGSGKSSLLREFLPTPSTKSMFSHDGYKSLSLIHRGVNYKLNYERTSGHQFFVEDTNLNKNGNHDTQRELILKYLGLDQNSLRILSCSVDICRMTPSQRKATLLSMNPIDVSMFIDYYKLVHKDVVAYSNNIDMLYERQRQLLSSKLPDDQMKSLVLVRDTLSNQEKLLLIWMTSVRVELDKYSCTSMKQDDYLPRIRSILNTIHKFSDIDRSMVAETLLAYRTREESMTNEIIRTQDDIARIVNRINNYELKKTNLSSNANEIEHEIADLRKFLSDSRIDDSYRAIPEDEIPEVKMTISRVEEMLISLTYIEFSMLLSTSEVSKITDDLNTSESELLRINNELRVIAQKIDHLRSSITKYTIPKECYTDKCGLFIAYDSQLSTKKVELATSIITQSELSSKSSILKSAVDRLRIESHTQNKIWEVLSRIILEIHKHSTMNSRFTINYLIDRVNVSPLDVINDMKVHVTNSEEYHVRVKVTQKLANLISKLEIVNSNSEVSASFITDEIHTCQDKLLVLRSSIQNMENERLTLKENYDKTLCFESTRNEILQMISSMDIMIANATSNANNTYLTKLYHILDKLLVDVRDKLQKTTDITKNQEMLLVRLNEEVISILDNIQSKYHRAKHIETALSELPIIYTRTFVNDLINTTNYFIDRVMTYPLEIDQIETDEDLDFTLSAVVNGVKIKDISSCSDGQMTIINLAFNLALLVELKLNDYPIFVDEIDRTLDTTHCTRLTELLASLIDESVISQEFVVNHHPSIFDAMVSDVIVLDSSNIVLPTEYNKHVRITYE